MADAAMGRIAKAIHTLFYADARAHERFVALETHVKTDDELAAFNALSIGLINFDPLPPEAMAGLKSKVAEMEQREADRPKVPSERLRIEANADPDAQYAKRMLKRMYTNWQGTLEYEPGVHRFSFFSPFDEQGRRHTVFASVSVDGYCPDLTVRNYVLGPYLRVADTRTKRESDDPWRVLGGDLTPLLPETSE